MLDGFDFDTSFAYTQSKDAGTPTWVWNTAQSRLEGLASADGTNRSILIYNNYSAKDTAVELVCSQAKAGGFVLRYVDQNNFYLVQIYDNTGSGVNTVLIYKRVAGTFTSLGTVLATFTRGTQYTFRAEIVGSEIKVYQNGTLLISATDSSLTSAGKVGLMQDGATVSYYHSFTIDQVSPLFSRPSTANKITDGSSVARNLPRYESGRNLLTKNQSDAETDLSGVAANKTNEILTRDTSTFWRGAACFKLVTPGLLSDEGLRAGGFIARSGYTYTFSAYVKGSGNVRLAFTGGVPLVYGPNLVLDGTWQRISLTAIATSGALVNTYVICTTPQAITFWVDGLQLEEGSTASTWRPGGPQAIMVEEGTTNLLGSGSEDIQTNWSGSSGSTATVLGSQSDHFGGTSAYRVQSSGGTGLVKWTHSGSTGVSGLVYSQCIWVKNNDAANMLTVFSNQGGKSVTVAASEGWKLVKHENISSNGVGIIKIELRSAATGTNIDCTVCAPQLEQKAYCTSYIPPGSTRSAERLALPPNLITNLSAGTIIFRAYVDGDIAAATPAVSHFLFDANTDSTHNRTTLFRVGALSNRYDFRVYDNSGASTVANWTTQNLSVGWHTFAARWSTNKIDLAVDGVSVKSITGTITVPTVQPSLCRIGTDTSDTQHWDYPIADFNYFPTYLSDADIALYGAA